MKTRNKGNKVKCRYADQYLGLYAPRCNDGKPCEVCLLKYENTQQRKQFQELKDAVQAIYYSAVWYPDRPVSFTANKWARVRDAAGFPKGCSPSPENNFCVLEFEEFKRRMLASAAGVIQVMSGKAVKKINVEYHE